jgi:hypothetical protein
MKAHPQPSEAALGIINTRVCLTIHLLFESTSAITLLYKDAKTDLTGVLLQI